MAISNTPKAVMKGWTALAICALGGYMLSKSYTNRRLQEYTATGSVTSSGVQQQQQEEQETGEKPLRRSVQRTL
ncbi:uncharacterized protein BX664DRAFT_359026 [Halteromyces radiatus]|uniref:uncharacterized protein n=1 Tax=Halteromyces radiatus TaxID=101107 RepID=UPI00221FB48E|nr:uncharacterized protein BX664DRAFT_359026 [Halteromyces radiatus]KAI8089477.1 hypothetical protein BX664DRAFT_359026 [Halteromyces radiatus]